MKDILFKEMPGRIVWALTFMATALLFACVSPPVHAGWFSSGVEQSGINLFELAAMIWAAKGDLPGYQLALLISFLLVPIASLFTSITPTPKPGTLWSFVYGYIEKSALKFWKSKDKPADTESRKIDGKPIDIINDPLGKITQVGKSIEQAVKDSVVKRLGKWFKARF